MNRYHFSLGDSTNGPIGYSGQIKADTASSAVDTLRELLHYHEVEVRLLDSRLDYLEIFFGPASAITEDDFELVMDYEEEE